MPLYSYNGILNMPIKNKKQHGQALPLAIAFLLMLGSVVYFMFNSGQLVQEKMRVTNTADAVAYSAGVFEARVLNYDAYTNRAIIANEIAIGQAVGLASWAQYAATAAENIGPYVRWIPYAGPAIEAALKKFKEAVDNYVLPTLKVTLPVHDGAIQALKVAQDAMHLSMLANRQLVMNKVAQLNDPDIQVDLIPIADDFSGFTSKYNSRNSRKRMGKVVSDQRESFLRSRNWQFGIFGCITFGLKKRGSTELIDQVDGWKSMDTVSYWYWAPKRFKICRKKELPIGYGTAFSKNNLNDSRYSYADSRNTNPKASEYADDYSQAEGFAPKTTLYGAIPSFYDLSSSALSQEDPRTVFAVRVTKAKDKQRFSGGVGAVKPSGRLSIYQGKQKSDTTASVAKVEVYFERPNGANNVANGSGKAEIGSLFNPYWQARLVPITTAERASAQLRQGVALP